MQNTFDFAGASYFILLLSGPVDGGANDPTFQVVGAVSGCTRLEFCRQNGALILWISGQPVEQCCTRKTVGDVEYSLVEEEDTSGYNCMTNCVFEKKDSPGSRFCFASGDLPVDCGDGGKI